MTHEEKRIKIAELCGWRIMADVEQRRLGWPIGSDNGMNPPVPLPDYPRDLNAIHDDVSQLDVYSTLLFCEKLRKICNPNSDPLAKEWNDNEHARAIIATAEQRCDAFLLTHGITP